MGKVTPPPPREAAPTQPTRTEIIALLTDSRTRPEKAALYADAYLEYRLAQDNITRDGPIVADPRTGAPIPNPYIPVRDKAFSRLEHLHKAGVRPIGLW